MTDGARERTESLLGTGAVEALARGHVAVFGLGGVGSWAAEALVRTGVGALTLVDPDAVALSDLNRQLPALRSTVGRRKTEVLAERFLDISPTLRLTVLPLFYGEAVRDGVPLDGFDLILDAIDTVPSKVLLIREATRRGIPILSSMGTGDRLDPEALTLTDLARTAVCPLARILRRELRKDGILHLPVVCSSEPPARSGGSRRGTPASAVFVPAAAGLLLAREAVRILTEGPRREPSGPVPPQSG